MAELSQISWPSQRSFQGVAGPGGIKPQLVPISTVAVVEKVKQNEAPGPVPKRALTVARSSGTSDESRRWCAGTVASSIQNLCITEHLVFHTY